MNNHSVKSLVLLLLILVPFVIPLTARAQLVNDTRVNGDSTYTTQERGRIGIYDMNKIIIAWEDNRANLTSIYMQKFNFNGQRLGNNILLLSNGNSPEIAVRKDGSFGLVFLDTVPKFRLFNNQGMPISSIVILDVFRNWGIGTNSISCDTNGNFVIAQEIIYAAENKNVYYQLIDSLGNKIGEKRRVNDDTTYTGRHQNPVVTKRKDGSFVIAWQDTRPPSIPNGDDIYFQIYDKSGTKIGNNTRVNDDTLLYDYQHLPQISSDDSGRFCIVFTQIEDNSGATYNLAQLYKANGTRNGNNLRFSSTSSLEQYPLISKRRNGDIVVCFRRDASANYIPYIQRINSSGTNIGNPFVVSSYYTTTEKVTSSMAFYDDKIITVWNDGRNGSQDVFFNIRSYTNPDSITTVQQISSEIPDQYELFQNYPNPFNPSTTIKYVIPKNGVVQIKLYDITGREVKSLVNEIKTAGYYSITFNASDLSSGVYFYRIQASDFVQTKRMVMIK